MAIDGSDEQPKPPACGRCGQQPLRHVTSIPRRFDQPSGFAIFNCESCGHLHWEPQPDGT